MLSNGGGDTSYLLQLIEELCNQNDKLMDDARREKEDLQQQVKSFIVFVQSALCMISNRSILVYAYIAMNIAMYCILGTTCLLTVYLSNLHIYSYIYELRVYVIYIVRVLLFTVCNN